MTFENREEMYRSVSWEGGQKILREDFEIPLERLPLATGAPILGKIPVLQACLGSDGSMCAGKKGFSTVTIVTVNLKT